jgi:hypothetical protein
MEGGSRIEGRLHGGEGKRKGILVGVGRLGGERKEEVNEGIGEGVGRREIHWRRER